MSRRIVVVTAGLTVPSSTRLLADQLAEATTAQVTARGESADIEFIELREVAGELATFMVTGGIPTPRLTELREQVAAADGLIVVTPVFNGSYSGLFKMFFDALDKDSLAGTPVLIAATAGSARHSLVLDHALRPLFAYLRAVVVPTGDLRRDRGLRQPRPLRPDHPSRGRARRAGAQPGWLRRRRVRPRPRGAPAAYVRHAGRGRRDAVRRPAPGAQRHRLRPPVRARTEVGGPAG